MPSLTSWILQSAGVSTFTAIATFIVYTKHVHFQPTNQSTDPLLSSGYYRKFNPNGNPPVHDLCTRKIPLFMVRRELFEDAERGGGLLVERFCGGLLGCFGNAAQRKYLSQKYSKDPACKSMLWTKEELLDSSYPEGTQMLNHYQILSKTPTTILIRAGDFPLNNANSPRPTDGLLEITAKADMIKGFAEFSVKSTLFEGEGKKEQKVYGGLGEFAHRCLIRLMVETGVKNCTN